MASSDAPNAAQRWNARLSRLTRDVRRVVAESPGRDDFLRLPGPARRETRRAVGAAVGHMRALGEVVDRGIAELEGLLDDPDRPAV
jgi:hypothetical protein